MATTVGQTARSGLVAGAIGAVLMVMVQGIARIVAGIPMFPDLLEDLVTRLIPAPVFSKVLDTLHFQAKPLLFVSLLVVQVVVGAVVGSLGAPLLAPRSRGIATPRSPWQTGFILAATFWLATGLVILPVAGQGVFGTLTSVGAVGLNLALLVGFGLFGLTTVAVLRVLDAAAAVPRTAAGASPNADAVENPERRRLLGGVAVGTVAVVAAGAAYKVLALGQSPVTRAPIGSTTGGPLIQPAPPPVSVAPPLVPTPNAAAAVPTLASISVETPTVASATAGAPASIGDWSIKGLASEVTPTKDFYQVSKDFFSDPVVDPKTWILRIAGMVNQPYGLGYDDLLKLPAVERYQTLQCISNEIGGDLIGNALWRGVSLRDVIQAAQPQTGAIKVVFTASDGYQDSITLDRALNGDNLIAHTMDGVGLVAGHGMPARLLIPGIYGMKNVKWLTKIELVSTNFQGYWQTRGWSDNAFINTMSRIDVPGSDRGAVKIGRIQLAGIAFAGDKGISKVEVSIDDGGTWNAATLKDPLGKYTWRLWRYDWTATPGEHKLQVRATNGSGEVQTSTVTDTLPSGATGWHSVTVSVLS